MDNHTFITTHARHIRTTNEENITEHNHPRLRRSKDNYATCSHVHCDGEMVYSYGSHFPLVFPVRTASGRVLLVANSTRYSPTTARHSAAARSVCDISVQGKLSHYPPTIEEVRAQLKHEIAIDSAKLSQLKRQDTQKAAGILRDINTTRSYLVKLNQ